jgi:hypothetical protein
MTHLQHEERVGDGGGAAGGRQGLLRGLGRDAGIQRRGEWAPRDGKARGRGRARRTCRASASA